MSGVQCQVSGVRFRCQVSGIRCQVLGVRCQVSSKTFQLNIILGIFWNAKKNTTVNNILSSL